MSVWKTVRGRFDPEKPADDPAWRVDRTHSPVMRIVKELDFDDDAPKVLLTGTIGCGKSTELLRLAELRRSREFVVFLDLEQHFDRVIGDPAALRQIRSWEVLFLVALKLLRDADAALGFQFDKQTLEDLVNVWSRAARASQTEGDTEFDLGKLFQAAAAMVTASVGAPVGTTGAGLLAGLVAAAGGPRWMVPVARSRRDLPDGDEALVSLSAVVNRMIGELQRRHDRVLVVLDGLDKVQATDRARALFIDSRVLGELACPVVAAGPFALRHRADLLDVPIFTCRILTNEPVFLPTAPTVRTAAVAVFERLFRARTTDLPRPLVSAERLHHLAWCSGGRARDFVRLVRVLAFHCHDAGVQEAGDPEIDAAVDELRRLWENGLHAGHERVLLEAMRDPHRLPDSELTWELLRSERLLPFPNDSEWYYPHPLLTLKRLRLAP